MKNLKAIAMPLTTTLGALLIVLGAAACGGVAEESENVQTLDSAICAGAIIDVDGEGTDQVGGNAFCAPAPQKCNNTTGACKDKSSGDECGSGKNKGTCSINPLGGCSCNK